MTPEEKWARLKTPQTVADYGLILTESELETFQEGREYLAELRGMIANEDRDRELLRMMGAKMGDVIEKVRYGSFQVAALPPNAEITGSALLRSPR